MEEVQGIGLYIWGNLLCTHPRSVHNIHIECLWVDVTKGFGAKWKTFFDVLEAHNGLNIDNDGHIWLLHRLFLDKINANARAWTSTWNSHTLSRQNVCSGMVTNGIQGIRVEQEEINPKEYGINWEDLDQHRICQHHDDFNLEDLTENNNSSIVNHPDHLSHVEVCDSHCPLDAEQLARFDTELQSLPTILSTDMHLHQLTWINALELATNIAQ
ncbi:hypothetical protein B0H34DRAFT_784083 [Crassisporium funariophilum]|nr:hypothetical protein B0H34DRAFT_784083 [Crassisporium funariophilum]